VEEACFDQALETRARNIAVDILFGREIVGGDRTGLGPRKEDRIAEKGVADCLQLVHI